MKAAEFRQYIEKYGKLAAVQRIRPNVKSEGEADAVIRIYIQSLLDADKYEAAAMVLWGFRLFDPRPQSVKDVWAAIGKHSKFLAQGGGALGKSYTIIAWLLLDWWRDPQYTAVKLISTTAGHAKANTFSTMTMLHREAIIAMPGEVFAEHIGLEASDKRACISVVKIPQGDDGKGRLQGFHPIPRPKEHPTLGWMSRVRVFIDEAEETPIGVWEGVDNMLTTIDESGTIKIGGAYNPKNQGSKVAQLAEPIQGWEGINVENHFNWESKAGWHVIRLDAAQCENVKQKKIIYPGLQTYEGYRTLATRRGGNTPEYWTFGRGWYPPSGAVNNIVAPEWLTGCRGNFLFTGPTQKFAGVDIAVEGRDEAILTVGRYGEAVMFTHESGRIVNFPQPRMCAQVDQQIILDKGKTSIVAHAIKDNCKLLQISPECVDVDRMQPITEPVLTPDGWTPIGLIKKGDFVIGSNGKKTKVLGVSNRNDKTVWRITLSDDSWTRCGPDHLWRVRRPCFGGIKWEVMRADEIRSRLSQTRQTLALQSISEPVEFSNSKPLPIDPWLLGFLIGDGNLRKNGGIRFSTSDQQSVDEVKNRIPKGLVVGWEGMYDYTITKPKRFAARCSEGRYVNDNPLLAELRKLELSGLLSHQKFIPDIYMTASPEDRVELIRGLMDSDGYVNVKPNKTKSPGCGINLNNYRLISQIVELVRSIGGMARIAVMRHAKKETILGRICNVRGAYRATFRFPKGLVPFRLDRKINQYEPEHLTDRVRRIISVEDDTPEPCVCIKVAAEDGLYVTRNYIVTHNTGNGAVVHDLLCENEVWSPFVMGTDFNKAATDRKILEQDKETAEELYDGIVTEVWFALARWMEALYIAISPGVARDRLNSEILGRKYKLKGKLYRVLSKDDMKLLMGTSPDFADSLTLFLNAIRKKTQAQASMTGKTKVNAPRPEPKHGVVDQVKFYEDTGI